MFTFNRVPVDTSESPVRGPKAVAERARRADRTLAELTDAEVFAALATRRRDQAVERGPRRRKRPKKV